MAAHMDVPVLNLWMQHDIFVGRLSTLTRDTTIPKWGSGMSKAYAISYAIASLWGLKGGFVSLSSV
jgi:hypothetical protein